MDSREYQAHLERWVAAVFKAHLAYLDPLVQKGLLDLKANQVLVDPREFREFLDRRVSLVHQERQVRLDRLVHQVRSSSAPRDMNRPWSRYISGNQSTRTST